VIPKGTPVKWSTNLTEQARGQGFKGSLMAGSSFHYDNQNAIELQRVEGLAKKDIAEIERMLKVLITSLENNPLNPWPLFSN